MEEGQPKGCLMVCMQTKHDCWDCDYSYFDNGVIRCRKGYVTSEQNECEEFK